MYIYVCGRERERERNHSCPPSLIIFFSKKISFFFLMADGGDGDEWGGGGGGVMILVLMKPLDGLILNLIQETFFRIFIVTHVDGG